MQNIAFFGGKHCFLFDMRSELSGCGLRGVLAQDAVGQVAMAQQLDGTVEVLLQPLARDARVGVVVQRLVDAGDGLHLLEHGADVVAHEDDGTVAVDFGQQLVEACFEAAVQVGGRFVEDDDLGVGDDGPSQQGALQLSAAQGADGLLLHSLQPHAGDDLGGLGALVGSEACAEALAAAEAREDDFLDGDGKLTVDGCVLGQVADGKRRLSVGRALRMEGDGAALRLQQAEDALDECGLTTSVGADDSQKVAVVDGEVYVAQHGAAVVAGVEVLYFDERGHRNGSLIMENGKIDAWGWLSIINCPLPIHALFSASPPPSRRPGD